MIERKLASVLQKYRTEFPCLVVTGPRQSGKTTLLRSLVGVNHAYVTFDDPQEREFATTDPRGFLRRFDGVSVILDEIQYTPSLLPYIKMAIDEDRTPGRFLMTGSQQFELMRHLGESLAGRVGILELLPFSKEETLDELSLDETLWRGAYPEPFLHPSLRELWIKSYVQTYLERDVRQLLNVKDGAAFQHFVTLSAARHGQEFHSSDFAKEVGVSLPTIKAWAGILAASYVIFLLQPFHQNWGKRLVRAPKLYFLDSALAAWLTRQPNPAALSSGSMAGAFFEGWVVVETIKAFLNRGMKPDVYFWRSGDGLEVDLLVGVQGRWLPVEVKLTASPRQKHTEGLSRWRALAAGNAAEVSVLVCDVEKETALPFGTLALPWKTYPSWLGAKLQ